jgi:predicted dehydrogenase
MRVAVEPPARPASHLRWGVLATGGIAKLFTRDLVAHGHHVAAVGSRSEEAATSFAEQFGINSAHGSYEELLADPSVDVVYVATPHNFHAANALAALEHGKHVLVEKPFTTNAREARTVVEAAADKGLLAMEAMWTRFLPHMAFVRSVVASGRIGEVRSLHADHTQKLPSDPAHRLNRLDLAGGALLDLGVYPISFAHDILGVPLEVFASGTVGDTGVDTSVATILHHPGGAVSTSFSSMLTRGPNGAVVLGVDGRIEIDPVWYGPSVVNVFDAGNNLSKRFEEPVSGRGMQYQAAEVERVIEAGLTASPLMAPADSVAVMETMDVVRAALGVRYPGE